MNIGRMTNREVRQSLITVGIQMNPTTGGWTAGVMRFPGKGLHVAETMNSHSGGGGFLFAANFISQIGFQGSFS